MRVTVCMQLFVNSAPIINAIKEREVYMAMYGDKIAKIILQIEFS